MELKTNPIFRCQICNTEYTEESMQQECAELCVKMAPLRVSIIQEYCARQNNVIDKLYEIVNTICEKEEIDKDVVLFSKHTYGVAVTIAAIPKKGIIMWDHLINLLNLYFIPVNKSSFIINLSLAEVFVEKLGSYFTYKDTNSQEDNT